MASYRKTPSLFGGFPLNDAQKAAAGAPASPILIVAGAGTGKTRTLTSRILYLIDAGVPANRICAITFTNKAAKEMASRLPAHARRSFIGTFHALGARILRRECRILGRDPNFVIFDNHDAFDLLKKILKSEGRLGKDKTPSFFMEAIGKAKNLPDQELPADVASVFRKYEDALARNNAFDFDDLIEKPVLLFKKVPEVLKRHRAAFDAVLVDEYQDINPMQCELVKSLAGGHRNISVVGDDEQTIYGWRYADVRTFLGFEKDWPGAKIYFLEENYRSASNIIRAAGAIASQNRFRTPKQLWTSNPEGERITLFEAWGENEEAEWIAQNISELILRDAEDRSGENARAAGAGRGAPGGRAGRRAAGSDIAILYRTNAQSRAIEQSLIRHGIPYRIFGGLKFYERREVKDAVAALRWTMNPRDEIARERLEKNLTKRKFALFARRISEIGNGLRPAEALKIFLDSFGYLDYLESNFLNAGERKENIAELIGFAAESPDLPTFLEKMSLLQATDDTAKNDAETREAVSLMTIHLAKGLEFRRVFIAGVGEGILPHIRSIGTEAQIEEERRLMYVAMTRAGEKLFISFYGMPSRFIAEIPEEFLEPVEAEESEEPSVHW